MSYNIESMKELFKKNRVREEMYQRGLAVAAVIRSGEPHILGLVEASDKIGDHEHFVNETDLRDLGFKIAKSTEKRGVKDLVLYYRDPFELVSMDEDIAFYEDWVEDIDHDTIKEVMTFERKPLEARFRVKETGAEVLVILVSFKSKGVFSVADIHRYEYLALANRKKLHGQSRKVRERLDQLLAADPHRAIIVMGDLNDEPGMDHFQKLVGASAVETITGEVHEPGKIMHNTLWHLAKKTKPEDVWTTEYPDPIVANLKKHKAWLDHIFVSPGMLKADAPVKYMPDSGGIGQKDHIAGAASDHFPVYCKIAV